MDVNGVERVNFNALGGADTDHRQRPDRHRRDRGQPRPRRPPGSGTGDGAADTVIVNGTNGDDVILVVGDASGVSVSGLWPPR